MAACKNAAGKKAKKERLFSQSLFLMVHIRYVDDRSSAGLFQLGSPSASSSSSAPHPPSHDILFSSMFWDAHPGPPS